MFGSILSGLFKGDSFLYRRNITGAFDVLQTERVCYTQVQKQRVGRECSYTGGGLQAMHCATLRRGLHVCPVFIIQGEG
jgi:hypothetical protein